MQRRWLRRCFIPVMLAPLTVVFMIGFIRTPTGREVLDGHDLIEQQYPLLSFIFDSVRDGHGIPLWNPYLFAGQSIIANPQATIFYPPAWIMIPLSVPKAIGLLIMLHLWIGAWGMAALAQRLGASSAGALVGGIVYGFSSVMGAHLQAGHLNYLLCQAWLPWIAAAYLASLDRPHWWIGGAAALGMCILCGYPPLLYFALLWLLILAVYAVLTGTPLRRAVPPLMLIAVIGVLLGAALLLPVGEFTLHSTRTQASTAAFSNSYALPGGQLIAFLIPNFFGQPRLPDLGYWGLPFYEEVTGYVGILPLIALLLTARLRRPLLSAAVLFAVIAAVGLIVSLGIDGGMFPTLYSLLPGYSLFRVPSRALYFVTVGAAGLTALLITALEQAATPEDRQRIVQPALRWILPFMFAVALITNVGIMVYFTAHSTELAPPWRLLYSANVAGLALVPISATWIVLRLWVSSGRRVWVLVLTGLVIVIDLWHISQPMVTVSAVDVPPLWKTVAQTIPGSPDYRVLTVPYNVSWQMGAMYTHHFNANGYDPLISYAYQQLIDASQQKPTSPIARLLGVRYAISDKPQSEGTGDDSLTLVSQADGWFIYETRRAMLHVFTAPQIVVMSDGDALTRIKASNFDPAAVAIVDRDIPCSASDSTAKSPTITRYEPNIVEIDTDQSGLLVLTDAYDPNWTVSVDAQPADLLRVDTALRGVCVPISAGTHQVRFEFRPVAAQVGLIVSVITWILLAVLAVIRAVMAWKRPFSVRHEMHLTLP